MSEKISIETITPEKAKALLDVMEKRIADGEFRQRQISEESVRRYANDMRQGHWLVNGDSLVFDDKDNAMNGRHRLWAVVTAGVPVRFSVLRGAGPVANGSISLMDTFDCGRKRTVTNQLQIDGVAYHSHVGSAARSICMLASYPAMENKRLGIIQIRAALAIYGERMPELIRTLNLTRKSNSPLLGALAIYSNFKPRKALEFADKYHSLNDLSEGSPVLVLKHAFEERRWSGGGHRTLGQLRICTLALFHWENGDTIRSLRVGDTGIEWLLKGDKGNILKLRQSLGLDQEETD